MSSAGLVRPQDTHLYEWTDNLNPADYLIATYQISTYSDGWRAAQGMAMEQSVGTTKIHHYLDSNALAGSCIRVRRVTALPTQSASPVSTFHLATPVYRDEAQDEASFEIELAFPLTLFAGKPAQLWNILIGEIPRLGFLSRFKLLSAPLPSIFGTGPSYGIEGLRQTAQQPQGPLLCRSMRPAVGLDVATMAQLNQDVLTGGFHIVKDDELIVFPDFIAFEQHVRAMIDARDLAIEASGEKKLYFANLICEPWELQERWQLCCDLGVDGVLIAPWIQGLGTLRYIAQQKRMPILAHNTLGELLTRHPDWCLDESLANQWLRTLGADLLVTTGNFPAASLSQAEHQASIGSICGNGAIHAINEYLAEDKQLAPAMPILQGGKNPHDLPAYRAAVGSDDFMLIVANWVDSHPDGLIAGAKAFRDAL